MVAYKDKASPANAFFQWPFLVENRYLFTNLKECSMRYRVLSYPSPLQSRAEGCTVDSGRVNLPALEPGETGYACIAAWENPEIRENSSLREMFGIGGYRTGWKERVYTYVSHQFCEKLF